jgi:hypothetical protein
LTRLKNEREMVRKKAEISKEPKDVETWREKAETSIPKFF